MFKFATLKTIYNPQGSALILTLVFGAVFLLSFGAVLSLILAEHKALDRKIASSRALEIAEAGLNQYRWQLAHNREDFTGTDQDYTDPYGTVIGHYTVTVEEPTVGSTVIEITSTGYDINYPETTRTVRARYGKPSLARYAFITNSNVWFGEDEEISGEVHSNGGIRMDGQCDSRMTTIKETYICGPEHGCNNEEKPGIWGTGEREDLWDFPVTEGVDFEAITVDLDSIMDEAITDGIYLDDSGAHGYRVTFNGTTLSIDTVTALQNPVWGYNGSAWVNESNSIQSTTPLAGYQNIALPDNGLIFIEDEVWVEGEVNGRVTLVAARLPVGESANASIRIQNDLTYAQPKDGSKVLGLIAQEDILVPLYSEDQLEIDAALLAQNGHTFRYYYPDCDWWCYSWCCQDPYTTYALRDKIETFGTNITNTIWTWSWVSSETGPVISGYQTTETNYDPYLTYGPPPSFPTEEEYEFISWEEILPTEED